MKEKIETIVFAVVYYVLGMMSGIGIMIGFIGGAR